MNNATNQTATPTGAEAAFARFRSLISKKELAERIGVHQNTIDNFVANGLPVHRLPGKKGRIGINPDEAAAWLFSNSSRAAE